MTLYLMGSRPKLGIITLRPRTLLKYSKPSGNNSYRLIILNLGLTSKPHGTHCVSHSPSLGVSRAQPFLELGLFLNLFLMLICVVVWPSQIFLFSLVHRLILSSFADNLQDPEVQVCLQGIWSPALSSTCGLQAAHAWRHRVVATRELRTL